MLKAFLKWMGFGLCHQLPERSYITAGVQAPVCARDTGIYVGFLVSLIVVGLLHRAERPIRFPRGLVWIAMGVLLSFMAWDGFTSYAGWRETTNSLRLITGLGVGFSAAVVIVPMLNDEIWSVPGTGRVLEPAWRFVVWLVAIPLAFVAIQEGGPHLGVAFPVLIAIGIVATLAAVNLIIVAMLPVFDRKAKRWSQVLLPAAIAVCLAFVEIAMAAQVRLWLIGLARLAGVEAA